MKARSAIAAIDCGTNSTRLLITDADGSPIDREMRITRLGQGVDASGRLAPEAIERCVGVLSQFRGAMDRHEVGRGRLVATSAVRDASNGDEFLGAAAAATGLTPELLTGGEEGRLSLAGAVSGLDPAGGPFLVLDIGGGSTELIAGDGADDPRLVAVSLQLGCVRVSERFLSSDPPTAGELAAAEAEIGIQLESASATSPRFGAARRLVGLAGTVSTLAALQLGLVEYERDLIHHSILSAPAIEAWCRRLAAESAPARLSRPGMEAGREDVIVGGALILAAVMRTFGFTECLVSEADILDGLIASM